MESIRPLLALISLFYEGHFIGPTFSFFLTFNF